MVSLRRFATAASVALTVIAAVVSAATATTCGAATSCNIFTVTSSGCTITLGQAVSCATPATLLAVIQPHKPAVCFAQFQIVGQCTTAVLKARLCTPACGCVKVCTVVAKKRANCTVIKKIPCARRRRGRCVVVVKRIRKTCRRKFKIQGTCKTAC